MATTWIDADDPGADALECGTCGCTAADVDAFAVTDGEVLCEYDHADLEQDIYDAAWLDRATGIYATSADGTPVLIVAYQHVHLDIAG